MRLAITGGYVVPVDGDPIEGGTVLVEDGRITAVGPAGEVTVPADAEVVDAAGQWVLPGFVEAHGHVGVCEEGEGWAGEDTNEMTDPVGARLRALDAINPADVGFVDALSGGVTTVVVKPGSGNPIGGRTVAVKCWGRTVDDMLIRETSVKSALGENPKRVYGNKDKTPSTRLGVAAIIRDALTKAEDYRARRDHARAENKPFDRDTTMETLVSVLDGELPWCQHSHRADDIATAIRLAEEFGYRLILNHGTEAHLLADLIAEKRIPVISGPLIVGRSKVEVRQRTFRNPGILDRAGVTMALTTDHPVVPINFLVHQATFAVKEGLDRTSALRSITSNPAEIMGLHDRVGALRPGLDADIVLWSGDPLDVMSRAMRVFVNGREVYHFDTESGEGVVADPFYREG
ncbi:amidohydrolase [Streptoalloteichus tenebrarius]|uniref:amidohydrolase n=1 Tax=Streptoalloteichus tenebrarius (strain ATCC 17920 / DSM 40477 / JCM 4838 / CBS 697.72 / NBRC 16177 / NCIMB 11028 / NRRL B-12390 / A12253. 1 / ISP 5477) TaxID=1933 RepID=UPI0020A3FEA3|nr:amidohydrolase [Streptoalloteichus tenebrarius]BFF01356.1 amidohydrolase [Streptoalloteichus tenebrarius]